MPKIATMTLKQLSVLRLMLRLRKVKSIQMGLLRFRAGAIPEHVAIYEVLQSQDEINGLDFGLMMVEARAVQETGANGSAAVPVAFTEKHLELAIKASQLRYGAEGSFGSQQDQAELLTVIATEQEGVQLALKTATEINGQGVGISQQMPRGLQ